MKRLLLFVALGWSSVAFAQSEMAFEGLDIQGEVQRADLAVLGNRAAWVMPIAFEVPTNFGYHCSLPTTMPSRKPIAEPVIEPVAKRSKRGRHAKR